jgi:predicted Rossmann-fold nucleotide-binding protein
MDEVFETATLIQTGKIREFPIVLMDGAYWQPLFAFMRQSMVPAGAVAESELALFTQAETADAVVSEILARVSGSLGLRWARTPGAKLLLAEADRRRQR